jgi:hypothetical protein
VWSGPEIEDILFRTLKFIVGCALALTFCVSARCDDPQQSLGDIARQAQKDRANKPAVKVVTNDDMPSASSSDPLGQTAGPSAAGKAGAEATPAEQLEKIEAFLNVVDSLDRTRLAKDVLQGKDVNFPGRAQWEQRLYTAKQTYVTQGRALIAKAKQIADSADSLKGVQNPNDPRAKEMKTKLQDLMRDSVQTGAAFQAVIMEGRDLATQASEHP